MTTIGVLSAVKAWTEEHICPAVTLKRAASLHEHEAGDFKPVYVHPAVYIVQMPPNAAEWEKKNPDAPIVAPAIIIGGGGVTEIDPQHGWAETPVTLSVQVWNPGEHTTIKGENGEEQRAYNETADGWMSLSSLLDRIAHELQNSEFPGGMRLVGSISLDVPALEECNFWPFYRGELRFTLQHTIHQTSKFENLL